MTKPCTTWEEAVDLARRYHHVTLEKEVILSVNTEMNRERELVFNIIPAPYSTPDYTPDELSLDYKTWWDAHNAMVAYCEERGLSPSNFWIDERMK